MEVLIQENNTGAVKRKFVRSGVAGNYEVILEMRRVIRKSVNYDKGLETLAKDLLIKNDLNSYTDPLEQLTAVYNFVVQNVKYIQDKAGLVESIKSARVTLSDGYGDCDDLTNTIATLCGDLGFENVKIAMARYDANDPMFVHVYPVVYVKDKRFVLDASLPESDREINKEVKAFEVKEIPVFEDVEGIDTGLSGFLQSTKHGVKKFGQVAVKTLPVVSNFLPLGFVTSQAVATSAQLLNYASGKELSINATASKINQELDKIIVALIRSQIALDMAISLSLQYASQLSAVQSRRIDAESYQVIKSSIQGKLDFIKNFESFALLHNIKIVTLNASAMMVASAAGIGLGAWTIYKAYKRGIN